MIEPTSYHPDHPFAASGGYYGHLSEPETQKLEELKKRCHDANISSLRLASFDNREDLVFLRYLRARNFDVDLAFDLAESILAWREAEGVNEILNENPNDILGCDLSQLVKNFPHWHCGYDKFGQPMLFKRYGGFLVWEILKLTSMDKIIRYHIWEQEMCMKLCHLSSVRTGYIVDTLFGVIDIENMGISQITRDFLNLVQRISEIDQKYYPETLGSFVIINTPSMFPYVWRGIRPWIDVKTSAKISIMASIDQWKPHLISCVVHEDCLPAEYGGSSSSSVKLVDQSLPYDFSGCNPAAVDDNQSIGRLSSHRSSKRDHRASEQSSVSSSSFYSALRPSSSMRDGTIESKSSRHHHQQQQQPMKSRAIGSSLESCDDDDFDDEEEDDDDDYDDESAVYASGSHSKGKIGSNYAKIYNCLLLVSTYLIACMRSKIVTKYLCCFIYLIEKTVMTWLCKQPETSLLRWVDLFNFLFMFTSLLIMSFGAYILSHMYWVAELVQWQMWTSVLCVCLGATLLVLSLVGFMAVRYRNRHLLVMFIYCLSVLAFVILSVSMVCFAYALGSSGVTQTSVNALKSALPGSASESDARRLLDTYNLLLAVGSLSASLLSLPSIFVSIAINRKWTIDHDSLFNKEKQLRVLLRVSNGFTSVFSLVIVGYGAYALDYVLRIGLKSPQTNLYFFFLSGYILFFMALMGFWTSVTKYLVIQSVYNYLLVPVTLFSVSVGIANLASISSVRHQVSNSWEKLNVSGKSSDDVITLVTSMLLVTGVLVLTACVFQFVNIISSHSLRSALIQVKRSRRKRLRNLRRRKENLRRHLAKLRRRQMRLRQRDELEMKQRSGNYPDNNMDGVVAKEIENEMKMRKTGPTSSSAPSLFDWVSGSSLKIDITGRFHALLHRHSSSMDGNIAAFTPPSQDLEAGAMQNEQHQVAGSLEMIPTNTGDVNFSDNDEVCGVSGISRPSSSSTFYTARRRKDRVVSRLNDNDNDGENNYEADDDIEIDQVEGMGQEGEIDHVLQNDAIFEFDLDECDFEESVDDLASDDDDDGVVLSLSERLIIAWAIASGLTHVFFQGTYIIFSRFVQASDSWLVYAFEELGKSDKRYITSDPYVVSMEGFLAIVVGPVCFATAWSMYLRKPYRHVLGMLAAFSQICLQIIFFSTEAHDNFRDVSYANNASFWFMFVSVNILRLVIPIPVLWYFMKNVVDIVDLIENRTADDRLRDMMMLSSRRANEEEEVDILSAIEEEHQHQQHSIRDSSISKSSDAKRRRKRGEEGGLRRRNRKATAATTTIDTLVPVQSTDIIVSSDTAML